MSTIKRYIFFFLVSAIFLSGCGSTQHSAGRDKQEQEKKLEERYSDSEKIIEDARERHYDMQTREAQKRMKETRRKSKEWNRAINPPFYVRWYRAVVSLFR